MFNRYLSRVTLTAALSAAPISMAFISENDSVGASQASRQDTRAPARPRAREAGVIVGVLTPGPLNAITDVTGVTVGHTPLIKGDNGGTGVTGIPPHGGNLFREKGSAAGFLCTA